MTILEWFFYIGIIIGILAGVFGLIFGIRTLLSARESKQLALVKVRDKRHKRRLAYQRKKTTQKKRRQRNWFFVFELVSILSLATSAYVSYYQAMNLTKEDADSIVKSYYLLRDFEKELNIAQTEGEEQEKVETKLRYFSTSLASYGVKKASELNTPEGQLTLNRYYNSVTELGVNVSTNYPMLYGNEELVKEYLTDIEKVKSYEAEVIKYYKVDQTALQKEE